MSRQFKTFDRADGAKGHFCVGYTDERGTSWFLTERGTWGSAGVIFTQVTANAVVNLLQSKDIQNGK